jgi:molybdenum cofactor cytidylyltransferase
MNKNPPALIVLAAGQGRRFGGNAHKLQQALGNSDVLGCCLDRAAGSDLPVVVVTTAALATLATRHLAADDVVVVSDNEARRGMGHTIAAGVAARPHASGWLILPGDMPLVQPATIRAVAAALRQHAVAYAQHHGRRGHPVGFAAELYSELVVLTGDEGARRISARYPAFGVDVDDPGVLMDVDTPADLAAAREALGVQAH